jgi:hypothetical protein
MDKNPQNSEEATSGITSNDTPDVIEIPETSLIDEQV